MSLRAPEVRDGGFLYGLIRDPSVRRYLGGPAVGTPEAVLAPYLTPGPGAAVWLVVAGAGPVGVISVTPHKDGRDHELSYQFDPGAWGRGYATEAAQAVLTAARAAGLARVIAETQAANASSRALLARLGMGEIARLERFGATQVIYGT
ncbi:MAG: GNAT family N-acetyltransferase [Pseudomonadota bacterium]